MVSVPGVAVPAFVGARARADVLIALSLFCEPPGADSIDFETKPCAVGGINGMDRGRATGTAEAGCGAVASGISTWRGWGTVIWGSAGWRTFNGVAVGAFVTVAASRSAAGRTGVFVVVPTCPQAAPTAKMLIVSVPTSGCSVVMMRCEGTGEHRTCRVSVKK